MNLLVTILSLTPAVGAVFRWLEEQPKAMTPSQKAAANPARRRSRLREPRRGSHARLAHWRRKKPRNPLRALRAA
jgi:hypothetical protein